MALLSFSLFPHALFSQSTVLSYWQLSSASHGFFLARCSSQIHSSPCVLKNPPGKAFKHFEQTSRVKIRKAYEQLAHQLMHTAGFPNVQPTWLGVKVNPVRGASVHALKAGGNGKGKQVLTKVLE